MAGGSGCGHSTGELGQPQCFVYVNSALALYLMVRAGVGVCIDGWERKEG